MHRRHRIIKKIEGKKRYEHRAKLVVTASFLFVILALPISVYEARYPGIPDSPLVLDSAQIARNVARGYGFSTNYIRPGIYKSLPRFIRPPDLVHPPLYIWLLAKMPGMSKGSFENPSVTSIVRCSTFFFYLTAILLYFIGRNICDFRTGFCAAVIYVFNVPILRAATSGTTQTLALFMVTLFFTIVYLDRNRSFLLSFFLGITIGFCYLTDYVLLVLIVPVIVHYLRQGIRRSFRHLCSLLIGTAVIVVPWMIRNVTCGGFLLYGQSLSSLFFSMPAVAARESMSGMQKFSLQLGIFYGRIIRSFLSVVMAFSLVSLVTRFDNAEFQRAKMVFWAAFGLVLLLSLMGSGQSEVVLAFAPVVILLGTKTFIDFIKYYGVQGERFETRLLTLFVVVAILPYMVTIAQGQQRGAWRWKRERFKGYLKHLADMQGMMQPGELIMTNAPEWLAFYGGFNTLNLPEDRKELEKWQKQFGKLRFSAVCPYGRDRYWNRTVLRQKLVPEWFITHEAYQYPYGEIFFASVESEMLQDQSGFQEGR